MVGAVAGSQPHDRQARALVAGSLREDGSWPSFLAAGWLGAAVLFGQGRFWEAARMQSVLGDRLPDLAAADVAALACALRRLDVGDDDWLLLAAQRRLAEAQRSDGGWPTEDGDPFMVHTARRHPRLPASHLTPVVGRVHVNLRWPLLVVP